MEKLVIVSMGELADKGIWSMYYEVHYGYKNSQGQMRAFQSPLVKNRKTKMIEVPDAALEFIDNLKSKSEAAKKAGDTTTLKRIEEMLERYNLDKNHYVNAIDSQGNIGILKLRHRAKNALDATIKRLRESGVDPLSTDNGRYFLFRRSGTGLDTTFQVEVATKDITVEGVGKVKQDLVHVLTDDILDRLGNEAAKLETLFKRPTSEQVARIVKEGASAVDEILDAKATTTEDGPEDDTDTVESTQTASVPTQTASAVTTPVTTPVAATPTPAPVAATPAPVAQTTTADNIASQSDEEFLKSLGLS